MKIKLIKRIVFLILVCMMAVSSSITVFAVSSETTATESTRERISNSITISAHQTSYLYVGELKGPRVAKVTITSSGPSSASNSTISWSLYEETHNPSCSRETYINQTFTQPAASFPKGYYYVKITNNSSYTITVTASLTNVM